MVGLHIMLVFLISIGAFSRGMEVKQTDQITDRDGQVLMLNITHKDSEEDIEVRDLKGNHIITVEMMENEGYQIDKPANENVCLLSTFDETETNEGNQDSTQNGSTPLCYDRVLYTESDISQQLQEHCAGREIYVLVSRKCNGDDASAVETGNSDEDDSRVKRGLSGYRCFWSYYNTLRYCRYSYCCWFCRRTCYRYKLCWVRVAYVKCGFYG